MSPAPSEPIAILGIGLRVPGASSPGAFWTNLRAGAVFLGPPAGGSGAGQIQPRHHVPAARLERVDGFDWRAFGVPPNQARYLDPQHRLVLEVVWESLEDAGIPTGSLEGSATSVHVGVQWNDYLRLHSRDPGLADSYSMTGNLFHFAANRVSHVLGLAGPSLAVDMGCASSLAALHGACQSLRLGECELALVAAVELALAPDATAMMEHGGLLDARGSNRTWDADAAGFARGEGAVAVVCKRAADLSPEERAYALVLGSALNHNGSNPWISAPSEKAQIGVLRQAWQRAGVTGDALDYVELHGTASPTGDAVEAAALSEALAPRAHTARPVRVGSVKSSIGHLGAAAGLAGLVKVALALHHRELPPGLALRHPNPRIPFEELGLEPQTRLSDWPGASDPPVAGVTAISLSGANAHVVVQGAPALPAGPWERSGGAAYLPLSARSAAALREQCSRFREFLTRAREQGMSLGDIAHTASLGRAHFDHRFCARGVTFDEWMDALDAFVASEGPPAALDDPVSAAYLRGEEVQWADLLPEGCRVVSVPTYPWQRQALWLPMAHLRQAELPTSVTDRGPATDPGNLVVGQLAAILGLGERDVDEAVMPAELGLDSLRALRLAQVVEGSFGVKLHAAEILGQTVGDTLKQVRAAAGSAARQRSSEPVADEPSERSLPLTSGQQAFWFHRELAPDDPAHHVVLPLELRGALDVAALRVAFERLVERHPMLRASFGDHEGVPFQRVEPRVELPWTEIDGTGVPRPVLERGLLEEAHRPLDLRRAPLLRLTIATLNARGDRHLLLLVIHHILVDFWSLAVLLDELGELYMAAREGRPPRLAPLEATYADHVNDERAAVVGAGQEELLQRWQARLAGLPPLSTVPGDRPRPARLTSQGASQVFAVDELLAARVHTLARVQGVTPFTVLLAAFVTLLSRRAGTRDLAVGTPTAGRTRAAYDRVVGYFVNPVVLRATVDESSSFHDLLSKVSATCRAVFADPCPLPWLVEKLQIPRSSSHHPLFQVMFALQQSPLAERQDLSAFALCDEGAVAALGDLEMRSIGLETRAVQFDLNLMLAPRGNGLAGTLEYNTSLFLPATAERLVADYVQLLEALTASPLKPVAEIAVGRQPRRCALVSASPPPLHTLHELVGRQVIERDTASAVVGPDGDEISYRELGRRARSTASRLRARGLGVGTVVGVCLPPSLEQVVNAVAVLEAGAALLPLDPNHPQERIRWMLQDAGAALVIADHDLGGDLPCTLLDQGELEDPHADHALPAVSAHHLAYVVFTSGSTGRPKGIMVSHQAIVRQVLWRQALLPIGPQDRVALLASPAFDIFVWELFAPLATGAQLVVAPPEARHDRRRLAELLAARRVTVLQVVSSTLARLVDEPLLAQCRDLRAVFCGGDLLRGEVAARLAEGSAAELVHLYGPAEAVIDATSYRCPGGVEHCGAVPIGRPADGIEIHLLDETLQPVAHGAPGELFLGGPGLARGYVGRPDLTAEHFLPDPEARGGRRYRTGDLARWNDQGELEFLGRRDEQVKIRGYRVELGEVEAALGRLPEVRDQAAVVRERDGGQVIVAYIVVESAAGVSPRSVRQAMAEVLPEYMVPAEVLLVETIPRLASGKVDRRRLQAADVGRDGGSASVGVRSHAEEMVAEVFSQLLDLEHVPPAASFFELGGHSLLALQVVARLSSLSGIEVPVRAVFDHPTVRDLGAFVVEMERTATHGAALPALVRGGEDEGPLSFAQEDLWLVDQLEPGSLAHVVPQVFRLHGSLDCEALERAFAGLACRHGALCAVFEARGASAIQRVGSPERLALRHVDLAGRNEADRAAALSRLLAEEARRPFDLCAGPLVRAALVRLGAEEHVLSLTTHHIACDGWSQALLLDELAVLYRAFAAGRAAPARPSAPRYLDYARWERQWLTGERYQMLARHWVGTLQGVEPLGLAVTRDRREAGGEAGATLFARLGADRVAALRRLCREERATLFMGLAAVLAVVIEREIGALEVVLGTPMSVRDLPELEGMVGNFVNLVPLRIRRRQGDSFRELLGLVREEALQAFAHRQLPFGRIVRELQPRRAAGQVPLLEVVFQLQSQPVPELRLGGIEVSPITTELEAALRYLCFTLTPRGGDLDVRADFDSGRFERAMVSGMLDGYGLLLERVVTQPTTRLAEVLRTLELGHERRLGDAHLFNFERE